MKTNKILAFFFAALAVAFLIVTVGCGFEGIFDTFSVFGAVGAMKASIMLASLGQPDDIEFVEGTENMGGFGMTGYLGLRSHITTYPTLDTSNTSLESLATLVGNYVFAASRNFITIDFVPDTLKVSPESQGEHVGGNSFMIKGEGFIAGTGAKNRGLARLLNNSYGILILNKEDGTRLGLGTYQRPLSFKASVDEGQKASDKKGVLISFEASSYVPGYEYNGEIPLDGSTLPAIS